MFKKVASRGPIMLFIILYLCHFHKWSVWSIHVQVFIVYIYELIDSVIYVDGTIIKIVLTELSFLLRYVTTRVGVLLSGALV